jgi:hypothetical protein
MIDSEDELDDELKELWEATERLKGPYVEWAPPGGPYEEDGVVLELGHPGVIEERDSRHYSVSWVDYEDARVSVGAVYDASNVKEIDVRTFCRRVLALPEPPSR